MKKAVPTQKKVAARLSPNKLTALALGRNILKAAREHARKNPESPAERAAAYKAMGLTWQRFLDKNKQLENEYLDGLGERRGIAAGDREGLAASLFGTYRYRRKPGESAETFCWRVVIKCVMKARANLPIREALTAKPGNPNVRMTATLAQEIGDLVATGLSISKACWLLANHDNRAGKLSKPHTTGTIVACRKSALQLEVSDSHTVAFRLIVVSHGTMRRL